MIVDWRQEAIHHCLAGMGISVAETTENPGYTLQFDDGDSLHLDLDDYDSIRLSIRRPVTPSDLDEMMERVLRFNFYKKSQTLRPLGYLLEESLVLRIILSQDRVRKVSLREAIENLRKARELVMDVRNV